MIDKDKQQEINILNSYQAEKNTPETIKETENNKRNFSNFSNLEIAKPFEIVGNNLDSNQNNQLENLTLTEKLGKIKINTPNVSRNFVDTLNPLAKEKYLHIEKILEEDLSGIYNNLLPKDQQKFKEKGEKTAQAIFDMIYRKTKIQIKKIINLIRKWLEIIPGINRYFLEQEAKIKADKIAEIAIKEGKKIEF